MLAPPAATSQSFFPDRRRPGRNERCPLINVVCCGSRPTRAVGAPPASFGRRRRARCATTFTRRTVRRDPPRFWCRSESACGPVGRANRVAERPTSASGRPTAHSAAGADGRAGQWTRPPVRLARRPRARRHTHVAARDPPGVAPQWVSDAGTTRGEAPRRRGSCTSAPRVAGCASVRGTYAVGGARGAAAAPPGRPRAWRPPRP